jgi:hypothetical protein
LEAVIRSSRGSDPSRHAAGAFGLAEYRIVPESGLPQPEFRHLDDQIEQCGQRRAWPSTINGTSKYFD